MFLLFLFLFNSMQAFEKQPSYKESYIIPIEMLHPNEFDLLQSILCTKNCNLDQCYIQLPGVRNYEFRFSLFEAYRMGSLKTMCLLLDKGANANITENNVSILQFVVKSLGDLHESYNALKGLAIHEYVPCNTNDFYTQLHNNVLNHYDTRLREIESHHITVIHKLLKGAIDLKDHSGFNAEEYARNFHLDTVLGIMNIYRSLNSHPRI